MVVDHDSYSSSGTSRKNPIPVVLVEETVSEKVRQQLALLFFAFLFGFLFLLILCGLFLVSIRGQSFRNLFIESIFLEELISIHGFMILIHISRNLNLIFIKAFRFCSTVLCLASPATLGAKSNSTRRLKKLFVGVSLLAFLLSAFGRQSSESITQRVFPPRLGRLSFFYRLTLRSQPGILGTFLDLDVRDNTVTLSSKTCPRRPSHFFQLPFGKIRSRSGHGLLEATRHFLAHFGTHQRNGRNGRRRCFAGGFTTCLLCHCFNCFHLKS
mmetsp:Transcript_10349/g.19872  ORF Transcript_10349/g.19872 Transcript_10349/m.19872 type:complete len:270 (+) Transcript_10349:146-955(+)